VSASSGHPTTHDELGGIAGERLRGSALLHDLRHTFGTRMAASGVPTRTLQGWLGHNLGVMAEDILLADSIEQVERLVGGNPPDLDEIRVETRRVRLAPRDAPVGPVLASVRSMDPSCTRSVLSGEYR
jgi:integrase